MALDRIERSSVYFITVTTDPEVDSPKVLALYAKRYGVDLSDWTFVTGEEAVLRGNLAEFRCPSCKKSARSCRSHFVDGSN